MLRLFEPYHKRFKLGSKPVAHLTAISQLSDKKLDESMPDSRARLIAHAKALLGGLPE